MRTFREMAIALEALLPHMPSFYSHFAGPVAAIAADLRALAERPTSEDVALIERVADLIDTGCLVPLPTIVPSLLPSEGLPSALRALAARLAVQQSTAAIPWRDDSPAPMRERVVLAKQAAPEPACRTCRILHGSTTRNNWCTECALLAFLHRYGGPQGSAR